MENDSHLRELSILPAGAHVPSGQAFAGAPAAWVAAVPIEHPDALWEPSLTRQFLFGAGQLLSVCCLPLLIFIAGAPAGLVLYFFQTDIEDVVGVLGLYVAFPIGAATVYLLLLALAIVGAKWALVGKFTAEKLWMYSPQYLAKWSVDNVLDLSMVQV